MQIIESIEEIDKLILTNTAVALGKFEGLHKGHRAIIKKLAKEKENGLTPLVFTFSVSPRAVFESGEFKQIYTIQEQILLFEKLGIDILIIYPIESGILNYEAQQFIKELLVNKLGVKKIICGNDFRFGKGRVGDIDLLKRFGNVFGFEVDAIDKLTYDGNTISSSSIRQKIAEGKMEQAAIMLERPYSIIGKVIHGKAIGRTLNVPTANIVPGKEKILPPNGVYFSTCDIDGTTYKGVTNIGNKPTIDGENAMGVETHFLDFEGDLYDKILEIKLYKYTRKEKKFKNLDELRNQLFRDIVDCKNDRNLKG